MIASNTGTVPEDYGDGDLMMIRAIQSNSFMPMLKVYRRLPGSGRKFLYQVSMEEAHNKRYTMADIYRLAMQQEMKFVVPEHIVEAIRKVQ